MVSQISKVLKPSGLLIGNVFAPEHYREWDRLKYGRIKSFRRRMLNSIAKCLYPVLPETGQHFIRRYGLSRIEPVGKSEILSFLDADYEILDCRSTYYHWFVAQKRSHSVDSGRDRLP